MERENSRIWLQNMEAIGMARKEEIIHIFIVNPWAGRLTFATDLRKKLSKMRDIQYFVFNTRYAGHEKTLVKDIQNIFENERLRFYCCGGSGTMRNMLNAFEDLSDVEVAFFPCGLTNDFLKVFGEAEKQFSDIEELINGEVVRVDYIKSNHGVALNTFSTGLDVTVIEKAKEYRFLNFLAPNMPYSVASVYAMLLSHQYSYEVEMDDRKFEGKAVEVFFGNGKFLGGSLNFAPSADVTDGLGNYRIIYGRNGFFLLGKVWDLLKGRYDRLDEISECGRSKRISIRRKDGEAFLVNQDGEGIIDTEWHAEIVRKGLQLVVPKGVSRNGR